jgi:hypothetical protein
MNKKILSAIVIMCFLMTACANLDSCSDGTKNNDETDVDCGGSCEPCPTGKACETDDDCTGKCSTNKVCYAVGGSTGTKSTSTSSKPGSATLTDDLREKVEEKLTGITRFAMSQNFKSMNPGEEATFAMGVVNVYTKPFYFKAVIEFDKAIDKYSNKLEGIDPEYVLSWINPTEFTTELGQTETDVWAYKIKVGNEVADGVPTKSGSYNFDVRVYYGDDLSLVESIKEKYVAKQPLAIRVP